MKVRRLVAVGLMMAALPLAGCTSSRETEAGDVGAGAGTSVPSAQVQAQASRRAQPTTPPPPQAGTGQGSDGCLAGTWNVDVADLAKQVATATNYSGGGTAEGTITVIFAKTLTIRYANAFTLTGTADGMTVGTRDSYSGDAVSADYTAKDGKIVGSLPKNVTKSTAARAGNQTRSPTTSKVVGTLDLSQGQTTYTCSGNAATVTNAAITWKLAKA